MTNKISKYYIKTGWVLLIYFSFTPGSTVAQHGTVIANLIQCVSQVSANRLEFFTFQIIQ